jgi:hypothetical protein
VRLLRDDAGAGRRSRRRGPPCYLAGPLATYHVHTHLQVHSDTCTCTCIHIRVHMHIYSYPYTSPWSSPPRDLRGT